MARPRGPAAGRAGRRPRLGAVTATVAPDRVRPVGSSEDDRRPAVEVEEPAPRTVLVRVRGELDEAAGLDLTSALDERLTARELSRVLVDLVGVTTLTNAGVCALQRVYRDCRVTGLRLVLVGTANPAVFRLLYLSGLLPLVDAQPTVQAALRPRDPRRSPR
jgi:anti-anti-sigma factor